jgi:hypothetical protein
MFDKLQLALADRLGLLLAVKQNVILIYAPAYADDFAVTAGIIMAHGVK